MHHHGKVPWSCVTPKPQRSISSIPDSPMQFVPSPTHRALHRMFSRCSHPSILAAISHPHCVLKCPSALREAGWGCFARFASFPCACCCCCLSCSDGWLLALAPSHREICHLMPGRGDSKSISMETALTGRLLSRPLGAGFFFASHLSASSPSLFCTALCKSSSEQTHLAPMHSVGHTPKLEQL